MTSSYHFRIFIFVVLFLITLLKMSMQRLAIVTAIGTHRSMKNRTNDIRQNNHPTVEPHQPNGTTFHGDVNVLLGGAMLSVVITIVCFVCYCCHRSLKQRSEAIYRQRWLEVDPNMDIYSVEQYYDISSNLVTDNDQYGRIMKNHGPPPSYEIAVAMKNPITTVKCRLCRNRIRLSCSCDSDVKSGQGCDIDNQENMVPGSNNQLLNISEITQQHTNDTCHSLTTSEHTNRNQCYDVAKTCQTCDEEIMPCVDNNLNEEDVQNSNERCCECATKNEMMNVRVSQVPVNSDLSNHDFNDNIPSTSGDMNFIGNTDFNCNYEGNDDELEDDDGDDYDSLNANGLIRVNMSQIIDQTGLPTYEAALKLESSGYV